MSVVVYKRTILHTLQVNMAKSPPPYEIRDASWLLWRRSFLYHWVRYQEASNSSDISGQNLRLHESSAYRRTAWADHHTSLILRVLHSKEPGCVEAASVFGEDEIPTDLSRYLQGVSCSRCSLGSCSADSYNVGVSFFQPCVSSVSHKNCWRKLCNMSAIFSLRVVGCSISSGICSPPFPIEVTPFQLHISVLDFVVEHTRQILGEWRAFSPLISFRAPLETLLLTVGIWNMTADSAKNTGLSVSNMGKNNQERDIIGKEGDDSRIPWSECKLLLHSNCRERAETAWKLTPAEITICVS